MGQDIYSRRETRVKQKQHKRRILLTAVIGFAVLLAAIILIVSSCSQKDTSPNSTL